MFRLLSGLVTYLFLALLPLSSLHAQQNGELRELLPTAEPKAADKREISIGAPLIIPEDGRELEGFNQAANSSGQASVRVGSVLVMTSVVLDHQIFESAIEPYLGIQATEDDLARLAQEIAEIARASGMILASARVPKQQVELGIVRILLRPGMIDEVRIEGSSNRYLYKLLNVLANKPAQKSELERRLMLAGDIRRISIVKAEILIEGERQILFVKVKSRREAGGRVLIDNYGSRNIGPLRLRMTAEAVALLDDSDILNVSYRTNPIDPKELIASSASYEIALNATGTMAEIATAWSKSTIDPRGNLPQRTVQSQLFSLGVHHPIRRSRTSNLWLRSQFEYLKIEQDSLGNLIRKDTVVSASVELSSSVKLGNGWLRAGGQMRQGLGILGATRRGDANASRVDADGKFKMARAWANWSGKLHGNITMRLAVSGQLASEALLSSEELGLGGPYVGKAFNFSEKSGDQGVLSLIEIGYDLDRPTRWLDRVQPYAFVDGGYVDDLYSGKGGGSLISAGGGVRAKFGKFSMQIEAAKSVYNSGRRNRDYPKINLQLGLEF